MFQPLNIVLEIGFLPLIILALVYYFVSLFSELHAKIPFAIHITYRAIINFDVYCVWTFFCIPFLFLTTNRFFYCHAGTTVIRLHFLDSNLIVSFFTIFRGVFLGKTISCSAFPPLKKSFAMYAPFCFPSDNILNIVISEPGFSPRVAKNSE